MSRQELRAMMEGMFISALIILLLFLGGLSLLPPATYWSIAIFAILSGMLALYYELKGVQEWTRLRRELIYGMLIGVVVLWLFFSRDTPPFFWGGVIFWLVFSLLAFFFERRSQQRLLHLQSLGALYCPRCGTRNLQEAKHCTRCSLELSQVRNLLRAPDEQKP